MDYNFKNLEELRSHIAVLKQEKIGQELFIKQRYLYYKKVFSNPFSFFLDLFKSSDLKTHQTKFSSDYITNLARVFLPILLNKIIFRKRGIFLKTIISMFSQKVINVKVINKDLLTRLIDMIIDFISSKTNTTKGKDYGIPEDSETY
jgi:hypothetical protein